jgi:GntR family transcriptional regulator
MSTRPHPTSGVLPLHHQIADALRAQMDSGELAPGDNLPTLAQLGEQWGCAPGTVSQALSLLRSEGRITSGRGKPAAVRPPATRITLEAGWTQEQKDLVLQPREVRAKRGAIEITAGVLIEDTHFSHVYDQVDATPDLAHEFGLEPGTKILRRTYEMTERRTGIRLSFSMSYIPVHLIESNPRLLDDSEEPWPGGHQHQLYTVGIEIDKFERSISTRVPTPQERQKWGMEAGVPLLTVRSRSIDIDGRLVEMSDADYPGDRTEIAFVEHLNRWPEDYPHYSPERESAAE